jgi:hypothetical protein
MSCIPCHLRAKQAAKQAAMVKPPAAPIPTPQPIQLGISIQRPVQTNPVLPNPFKRKFA